MDNARKKALTITFLVVMILVIEAPALSGLSMDSNNTLMTGWISYWPKTILTINAGKAVGTNSLSIGFQLDWDRWKTFVQNSAARSLAQDAGFKLVRVFDFRPTTPKLMPCTYWNESSGTGNWDWTNVDSLVQRIFETGAEPFFCLGWARDSIQNYIPPGMAVDPVTLLPYPNSYRSYCDEWVRHFKNIGRPVRYYEIMDEPWAYFGWNPSDTTKLANYVQLWNTVARGMRAENPGVLLSNDAVTQKNVLAYWINHGDDIDFLDFHKYDEDTTGQYSDTQMFSRAETRGYQDVSGSALYGINTARQIWFNARGKWLPAVDSESNFSSAWQSGTEPRMQQMAGAVWLALSLRTGILAGLNYNIYFEFASSKSYQVAHGTGWGFGMTNQDDNQPWYPYYVHKLIGANLGVGDQIVETASSSNDMKSIAWIHGAKLNILIISTVDQPRTLELRGINGEASLYTLDNATSSASPTVQSNTIVADKNLVTNGYMVALVQLNAY